MPACSACHEELARSAFAQAQLKKSADTRRCKECTTAGTVAAPVDMEAVESEISRLSRLPVDKMYAETTALNIADIAEQHHS